MITIRGIYGMIQFFIGVCARGFVVLTCSEDEDECFYFKRDFLSIFITFSYYSFKNKRINILGRVLCIILDILVLPMSLIIILILCLWLGLVKIITRRTKDD